MGGLWSAFFFIKDLNILQATIGIIREKEFSKQIQEEYSNYDS